MKRIWNPYYVAALVLPLLLIALIPALRLPAFKLLTGSNGGIYDLPMGNQSHYVFQPAEMLARQPDSLDIQAWCLSQGTFPDFLRKYEYSVPNSKVNGKMRAFAALWKAHPQRISLLVQALVSTSYYNGRVAGPWEDRGGWSMPSSSVPPTSSPSSYPSMAIVPFVFPNSPLPLNEVDESDAQLGLRLARQGQALEPDNTFFDWMAAHFLFTLRRDDEAVKVLLKARDKTGFNMHWREFLGGFYSAFQSAGPLLAEEKLAQTEALSNRYSLTILHTARMALWCAMQRETGGDAETALSLERALARLEMTVFRRGLFRNERDSLAYCAALTWRAPEVMKWSRVLGVGKPPVIFSASTPFFQSLEQRLNKNSGSFMAYARAHGRPDVAQETATDLPGLTRYARDDEAGVARESFLERRSGGAIAAIHLWWWFAVLAVIECALSAALWLAFTILGPYLPPRGETVPHLGSRALVYPLVIGSAAALCSCGLSALMFCRGWRASGRSAEFWGGDGGFYGSAAVLCPFVAAVLYSAAGTLRRTWKQPALALNKARRFAPCDLGTSREMDEFLALFWRVQNLLWFRVLPWVTFPLLATYVLATFPLEMPWGQGGNWIPAYQPKYFDDNLGAALFVGAFAYLAALAGRWVIQGRAPARKAAIFAGSFALRRALAWCIPLSLWLLLVTLVFGSVARGKLDRQMEAFLRAENRD